ncbi:Carboxylic ester hydrolase [Mycena venus]|uniref:Carboxylic ester hydrolase n=1 Tax=Mycena venus TaxID=2733690 RepID=A0A8H6XUN8_9AGAR|nr:Carboxylic ester hydrolase [Mycena venus]
MSDYWTRILLLRWVNKHISSFGGDPSKVTIWGQSAGAGPVLQHVVANDGKTKPQLFRAAMTSSTFFPSQYHYNDPIREFTFNRIVEQSNCTTATNVMACLRSVDADVLQTINVAINNSAFFGTYTLVPVVDGSYITQRPTLSLLQDKINGGALLSVTNTFEGAKFVDQTMADTANATTYALELFPAFGPPRADKVGAIYAGLGTQIFQQNVLMGELIFICPTYGGFAIPPGQHANDVPYYWPSSGTLPPFNNTVFIDAFAQTFTSFAMALDPNVKVDSTTITPPWNRWEVEHTEMLFNARTDGRPVVRPVKTDDALLARCQWVQIIFLLLGNTFDQWRLVTDSGQVKVLSPLSGNRDALYEGTFELEKRKNEYLCTSDFEWKISYAMGQLFFF